jgi:gentisate 1,2-dioxygenase
VSSKPIAAPAVESPARRAFYERISRQNLTPVWLSLANLVTAEPVSGCQPAAWTFTEIRAAMLEAGSLITAKEAWDPLHGLKTRYANPMRQRGTAAQ